MSFGELNGRPPSESTTVSLAPVAGSVRLYRARVCPRPCPETRRRPAQRNAQPFAAVRRQGGRIARGREALPPRVAGQAALVVEPPLLAQAEPPVGRAEHVEELPDGRARLRRGEHCAVDLRGRPDALAQLLGRGSERD